MRVLFTSLRNTSHFQPLLPFIAACTQRGHSIAVAAPSELAERARGAGAEFFEVGHPGDEALRPIWARLHEVPHGEANRIVIGEIFAGADAAAALPALMAAVEQWKPDVLVRESQEYAAVIAAEHAQLAHARVSITLARMEHDAFAAAAPSLDAHRGPLGLPSDPLGERLLSEPALSLFPLALEDRVAAERLHVHRFRARPRAASALPAWWSEPDRPLVYLTLGTVAGGMDRLRATYRTLLDAVAALPVRALLTVGMELPLEALGDIPEHVHVERFVPQDDVFPHASAVVCHGGAGTMLGALAAGLPMLVVPMFADQPHNAQSVVVAGAGLSLDPRAATPQAVRSALTRVLDDASMRSAARDIAAEIAQLPPVDEAPAVLEQLAN